MRFLSLSLLGLAACAVASPLGAASSHHNEVELVARAEAKVSTHPQVKYEDGVCTVKPLGGNRDDSSALLYAFNKLCKTNSTIKLPGFYVIHKVLNTSLTNSVVELSGAIQYTADIGYWSPNSIFLTYQNATTFWFFSGNNVTMNGGGTIDGNGQIWWERFATNKDKGVAGGSSRTFSRPIPLVVGNASHITISDIKVVNSPFWNNMVYQSSYVTYEKMFIEAVSYNNSIRTANSDGWDIYRSDHVVIKDSWVNVQDDCVSFKPNSTFVQVWSMYCNGTHGTSIGSLGQYAGTTDIVSDIAVWNITMLNAENAARIKVFPGSNDTKSISGGGSGYVRNVTFSDFYIENVDYPIVINQCYQAESAEYCAANPATLLISDVHYRNFTGVTSGHVANGTVVELICSSDCINISASEIDLKPPGNATAQYICENIVDETLLDFKCTAPGDDGVTTGAAREGENRGGVAATVSSSVPIATARV